MKKEILEKKMSVRSKVFDIAIYQHSFAVIHPKYSYQLTDVIYCINEGQYVLRQLAKVNGEKVLRARNPAFSDIKICEDFQIIGKVIFSLYFQDKFTPVQLSTLKYLTDTQRLDKKY